MKHTRNLGGAAQRIMESVAIVSLVIAAGPMAKAQTCTTAQINGFPGARFSDGSFGFRSHLNVNPDGGKASYTVGDHGYTYISNGVNKRSVVSWTSCRKAAADCHRLFKEAEQEAFGTGTQEFCAFALEVEPIPPQTAAQECGSGRKIIGNGKGRPVLGPDELETVDGQKTRYYKSMTHLNQWVDNRAQSVDSITVPMIVVPTGNAQMLGRIVYLAHGGRSTLAVVGDTGPDLGEASIAVHELLLYGTLQQPPPIGPIKLEDRCGAVEKSVKPPYSVRPDVSGDYCMPKRKMVGAADIRGYANIAGGVKTIVLGKARLPMKSSTVAKEAITLDAIKKAFDEAGYTHESLDRMIRCIAP